MRGYIAFLQLLLFISLCSGKTQSSDLSIQKYNEKGEIAQLVYSSKAVQRDTPLVAFIDEATEAAFILSVTKLKSPLTLSTRRRIEHLEEEGIVSAIVGYIPDCDYARNHLYAILQNHRLTFGERPSLECISSQMSSWMTRGFYTQQDDPIARPLAACVVLVSFLAEEQRVKLVHVDNSGFVTDRNYIVTGALPSVTRDRIVSTITSPDVQDDNMSMNMSVNQQTVLSKIGTVLRLMIEAVDPSDITDVNACVDCSIITKRRAFVKHNMKIEDIDEVISFIEDCCVSD
jgi:20S proteasome alpha/beta subunit